MKNNPPLFRFKKIAALALALLVLSGQTVSAASAPLQASSVRSDIQTPAIAPELGTIEESWSGTSKKTVLFIQDAHESIEAQRNISRLLLDLVDRGIIRTVYEEGYEGAVPADPYFAFLGDARLRRKISDFLLQRLWIGGAEYAYINRNTADGRPRDFRLIGADNVRLHLENIDAYREAAQYKLETAGDLRRLRARFEVLAREHYPEELKEFIRQKDLFESGKLNLIDYVSRAVRPVQDFERDFPQLSALVRLSGAGSEVPAKAADFDARVLFEELDRYESRLAESKLRSGTAREIYRHDRELRLLERLNSLAIPSEEFAIAKKYLAEISTEKLGDFIAGETHRSLVLSRIWERNIRFARRFYEKAGERDQSVRAALEKFRNESSEDTAALVFGGFHKERIREILKSLGLSYVVVSPKISAINADEEQYYRAVMARGVPASVIESFPARATPARRLFEVVPRNGIVPFLNDTLPGTLRSELRRLREETQRESVKPPARTVPGTPHYAAGSAPEKQYDFSIVEVLNLDLSRRGGTESYVNALNRKMLEMAPIRIHIIYPVPEPRPVFEEKIGRGVIIHQQIAEPSKTGNQRLNQLRWALGLRRLTAQAVKQDNAVAVHSHILNPIYNFIVLGFGKNTMQTMHLTYAHTYGRAMRAVRRFLLSTNGSWSPLLLGVSAASLPEDGARAEMIGSGIDTDFFAAARAHPDAFRKKFLPGLDRRARLIFYPARFSENNRKGQMDLVEVAGYLRAEMPRENVHIVMMGTDQNFRDTVQRRVEEEGLSDYVHLLSATSLEDVRDGYAASEFVVMPSYSEALGLVPLEAQAMGKPVITYDSDGLPDAVGRRSGILVHKGDIEGLKIQIAGLLRDREWRRTLGSNGRDFVYRHYSLEVLARRQLLVYRRFTAGEEERAAASGTEAVRGGLDVRSEIRRAPARPEQARTPEDEFISYPIPAAFMPAEGSDGESSRRGENLETMLEKAGPTHVFIDAAEKLDPGEARAVAAELGRLAEAGAEVVAYNAAEAPEDGVLYHLIRTFPKGKIRIRAGSLARVLAAYPHADSRVNFIRYSAAADRLKTQVESELPWTRGRVYYVTGKSGSTVYAIREIGALALKKTVPDLEIVYDGEGYHHISDHQAALMNLFLAAQTYVAFATAA